MADDRPKRGGLREDQVTFETTKGVEVISTFDQMNFKEDLIRGIYAYGVCEGRAATCVLIIVSVTVPTLGEASESPSDVYVFV